jgi:acetyl esterase/lipase
VVAWRGVDFRGSQDASPRPANNLPFCPIRNVTEDYPPTLLIHGDQDTDVPFRQSVLMAEELESRGAEHELIAMPNRGHVFDLDGEGMVDDLAGSGLVASWPANRRIGISLEKEGTI